MKHLTPFTLHSLLFILHLILVHAAGNAQAGQNSCQDSYYRLNNKFPSFFFHNKEPLPPPSPRRGSQGSEDFVNGLTTEIILYWLAVRG